MNIPKTSFILLLALPLCTCVLRLIHTSISGDVLMVTWANILSFVIMACTSLSLYAALGYTTRARAKREKWWPFVVMYAVGLLLVYGSGIVAYRLYMTPEGFASSLPYTLSTNFLNIGIEAVIFALTIIFVGMVMRRHPHMDASEARRRLTLVPVIICALNSLVWALASTAVDIATVGLPINLTEVVYLVSPYIVIAVTAAFGWFVVRKIVS